MFKVHVVVEHRNTKELQEQLDRIERMLKIIMAKADDLQAALDKIDAATTAQGETLAAEAVTIQNISDDFDTLIQAAKDGALSDAQLAQAQAAADTAAAVATSLKAHADSLTGIAAKVETPVPTPAPEPTPVVTP